MESHDEVPLLISKPKIALLKPLTHNNLFPLFSLFSGLPWRNVKKDTRDSFYSSLTVPDHISCAHQREYILDNNPHGLYNGYVAEDTQALGRQVSYSTVRVLKAQQQIGKEI